MVAYKPTINIIQNEISIILLFFPLGAVHKGRLQSGGREGLSRSDKGGSSALFGAKNSGIFKIYGVFARTRGGVNFSRFYAELFMDGFLLQFAIILKS